MDLLDLQKHSPNLLLRNCVEARERKLFLRNCVEGRERKLDVAAKKVGRPCVHLRILFACLPFHVRDPRLELVAMGIILLL
jgi:hypothetical protein